MGVWGGGGSGRLNEGDDEVFKLLVAEAVMGSEAVASEVALIEHRMLATFALYKSDE